MKKRKMSNMSIKQYITSGYSECVAPAVSW